MSQGSLCRLCVNICEDHKCIYDEIGHGNEAYQLMMKYFDPAFLNMDSGGLLTVICIECWRRIFDFNNYQQSVYQAQLKLNDKDKSQELKLHNELASDDVNKYPTQNIAVVNGREVYIKAEDNSSEHFSSYTFGSSPCYDITKREEEELPKDGYLPDVNHSTFYGECQIGDIHASSQRTLAMPKLEIIDVFSGEDISQEAILYESDSDASGELNEKDDSADGVLSETAPSIPTSNALTKTKYIADTDDFIKQWKPSLTCSLCMHKCSTYSLLQQHFIDNHPLEKCYIMCCQRKFYIRNLIKDHINHHIDPNVFNCELCDKSHITRRQLADHVRKHHSKSSHGTTNILKRKMTPDRDIDNLIAQWKPILECALCRETCSTLKQLQLHFRQNHPQIQFYIECCSRKLKKRYEIEGHAWNHVNPNNFTCELCSCPFSSESNLIRHMRIQHSKLNNEEVKSTYKKRVLEKEIEDLVAQWKPNLECTVCRITCPTLTMLQVHFSKNHPLKQFYIECCNRKIKRRYDIIFHARSHVDPITFRCELCISRFSNKSNLNRHMRIYHSNPNNEETCAKNTQI